MMVAGKMSKNEIKRHDEQIAPSNDLSQIKNLGRIQRAAGFSG
jgi:hypothetical protein